MNECIYKINGKCLAIWNAHRNQYIYMARGIKACKMEASREEHTRAQKKKQKCDYIWEQIVKMKTNHTQSYKTKRSDEQTNDAYLCVVSLSCEWAYDWPCPDCPCSCPPPPPCEPCDTGFRSFELI